MNPKAYRLPTQVFPEHYDIQIDVRPGSEDFHGKVAIQIHVLEPRDTIEIHARDLELSDAIITIRGAMRAGVIYQDNEREMVSIHFGEDMLPGDALLEISFAGQVSKSMEGLYHAHDGSEECLCTQCEETDARGAMLLAERVREELGRTTFHHHGKTTSGGTVPGVNVACSVGIATFPDAGGTWEELFKAADDALYVSKRSGRNRSTAWGPAQAKTGRALPAA